MIESIQKMLLDPELLIEEIQAADPKIEADFTRIAWLPYIKCSALRSEPPDEAFSALMYMWLKQQIDYTVHPQNKEKKPMDLLIKLFGVSVFSDLKIIEMKRDWIGVLTSHLVSDHGDERRRVVEINSLKKTEGIQIKCGTGNSLIFGRTSAFYFLVDDSYLTERSVPSHIDEILFNDDMPVNIRKRPGMYIGSTTKDGLYRLLYGLVEELLEVSTGNSISIRIQPDNVLDISCGTFSIQNNPHHLSDISVVNALSEHFLWQDAVQELRTEKGSLVKKEEKARSDKGIRITWKPDASIFNDDIELDYYIVLNRMIELASLNPYKISLSNRENQNTISIPAGIKFLLHREPFRTYEAIPININFDGFIGYAAIMFSPSALTGKSYVNNQLTIDGGTHVKGLLQGTEKALKRILDDYRNPLPDLPDVSSKDQGIVKGVLDDMAASFSCDDILENLNYVIHMKVKNPRFYGSWRNALKNIEVKPIVEKQVEEQLYSYLKEDIAPLKHLYPWVFDEKRKR